MKTSPPARTRTRDLALIHLAKKDLGLDDDTYRAMLHTVARVDSSAKLDWAGRQRVIAHLKARGFKPKQATPAQPPAAPSLSPISAKIISLWQALHTAGLVRDASEGALNRYVKRQTGVSAHRWLNAQQASSLVESLKLWLLRANKNNTTPT